MFCTCPEWEEHYKVWQEQLLDLMFNNVAVRGDSELLTTERVTDEELEYTKVDNS